MNNKPVYLTPEGVERLNVELRHLITEERPRVAARIHDAKLDGDISENAEYEDAKQEQSFLEGRIATIEAQLKNAEVIEHQNGDKVRIGSTVVITGRGWQGDLHHRGLRRGRAPRWADQQRVAGGRRAHGPQEGGHGHGPGTGRGHDLHAGQHQVARTAVFWADEIAARAAEASGAATPQVINDSKTPSGTVHVGSLRGPVIHDEIYRAMRRAEIPTRFLYGVDDLDPMDAQALLTPDAVDRYMGVPLAHMPAPDGSPADSYARHFVGSLFLGTFEPLGIRPELYWMSEVYGSAPWTP